MTFQFDQFSAAVRAGGNITAMDTQALRHWAWADGMLSQRDAQALFELNGQLAVRLDLFVAEQHRPERPHVAHSNDAALVHVIEVAVLVGQGAEHLLARFLVAVC